MRLVTAAVYPILASHLDLPVLVAEGWLKVILLFVRLSIVSRTYPATPSDISRRSSYGFYTALCRDAAIYCWLTVSTDRGDRLVKLLQKCLLSSAPWPVIEKYSACKESQRVTNKLREIVKRSILHTEKARRGSRCKASTHSTGCIFSRPY